jgi:hypothetical protein
LVDQEAGADRIVAVRLAGGQRKGKQWRYPARLDCAKCHVNRGSLGFLTPQLNRPASADTGRNQMQDLVDRGVLAANPVAGKPAAFRWVGLAETGPAATLEAKSRSYLAANCSQCHGNGNFPGPRHDFDYFNPARRIDSLAPGGYVGRPPIFAKSGFPRLILPGRPDSSLILKRMLARGSLAGVDPEQMPPLATFQPDSAAVKTIRDWVCSLASRPAGAGECRLPMVQAEDSYWGPLALDPHAWMRTASSPKARLRGRILELPRAARDGAVALFDLRGSRIPLQPAGSGVYRLPSRSEAGIYLLRAPWGVERLECLP